MKPDSLAVVGSLTIAQNNRRLDALRFGFERLMELACSWVATTPETELKIQLGKVIWHAAMAADALVSRLDELQGLTACAQSPGPLYTAFTNALLRVEPSEARMALLHGLVLPDLRDAVRAHREAVHSFADSLTEWVLLPIEARLKELLAWYAHGSAGREALDQGGGEAAHKARELFQASGGVAGPQAQELSEPLAALARTPRVLEVGDLVETPARDKGLQVLDPVGPGPSSFTMFVHSTIFNIEICATEICARIIIEHRDAPWKLKVDMARQVYDEVRHAESLLGRLRELGGTVGEFPIDLRVWRAFRTGESLAEQLMLQQRIGEGGGLDGGDIIRMGRIQAGDERTARLFEYINADEINHVRNGNRWLAHLLNHDAAALAELERKATAKMMAIGCKRPPLRPWVDGRRLAGFTERDIKRSFSDWEEFDKRRQAQRVAAASQGQAPRGRMPPAPIIPSKVR
jgi:uncharacterized ferritin-like protein (DUF455 family)